MRTERRGERRRVTPPCRIEATRPMNPRRRPFRADVYPKRSYVINGRENSIPEKNRMKVKWVRFSKKCELVLCVFLPVEDDTIFALVLDFVGFVPIIAPGAPFNFVLATLLGSVSGKDMYR
jgi:hypothetical protein